MSHKRTIVILIFLLLSACSTQNIHYSSLPSEHLYGSGKTAECARLFVQIDEKVWNERKTDVQSARIAGFPYLRVNRLLADLKHSLTPNMFTDWFVQMRKLDQEARHHELQNVSSLADKEHIEEKLNICASILMQADLDDPTQLEKLIKAAVVPDSYIVTNRILGFYFISRVFVNNGIRNLHEQIKTTFSNPLSEKNHAQRESYRPENAANVSFTEIQKLLSKTQRDKLSIPEFDKPVMERLFDYYAPVWEIEVKDRNDMFGSPVWLGEKELIVETNTAKTYRHLSYTKLNNEILTQLNYVIWFPSRPARSKFDILSGNVDGLTWRVTIAMNGKVLMYDVMHNCGCYHMFFPPKDVHTRMQQVNASEEALLVPQRAPDLEEGERIHVNIMSGSHYLSGVGSGVQNSKHKTYRFADYEELRSLPMTNGQGRSMFDDKGIVPGTSRKERMLLWPMGVKNAGAMRQWGHHATAFIGRRHFDDVDLLERYFEFSKTGKSP
jgi:hypothetical protein